MASIGTAEGSFPLGSGEATNPEQESPQGPEGETPPPCVSSALCTVPFNFLKEPDTVAKIPTNEETKALSC